MKSVAAGSRILLGIIVVSSMSIFIDSYAQAETQSALEQLESIAGSSADAASAPDLETTRATSEFEVREQGKVPVESVYVPEAAAIGPTQAQIQVSRRIADETEGLVSKILETDTKRADTKNRSEKVKEDIEKKQSEMERTEMLLNHPRGRKEVLIPKRETLTSELNELEKMAKALEQEASQLNKNADQQREKYEDLKQLYDEVLSDPELAEDMMQSRR
ncbi:MAG: hypothetical protein HQL29_02480 [Candidatus Omnitrophica bacterium]|nr:hypothetical protein [Candidatus Omnitrophota bacterium]